MLSLPDKHYHASDPNPAPSKNLSGLLTIKRSYIAIRAAEALSLPQVEFPAETIVFVDKWDKTAGPASASISDSWIEPFNGDFDYYPTYARSDRSWSACATSATLSQNNEGPARLFAGPVLTNISNSIQLPCSA